MACFFVRVRRTQGWERTSIAGPEQRPRQAPTRARALSRVALQFSLLPSSSSSPPSSSPSAAARGGMGEEERRGRGAAAPCGTAARPSLLACFLASHSSPSQDRTNERTDERGFGGSRAQPHPGPHARAGTRRVKGMGEGSVIAGGFFLSRRKGVTTRDLARRYRQDVAEARRTAGARPSRGGGRAGAALGNHSERLDGSGRLCEGQGHKPTEKRGGTGNGYPGDPRPAAWREPATFAVRCGKAGKGRGALLLACCRPEHNGRSRVQGEREGRGEG
ncbi:uncharacterized protein LOC125024682 [Penaeus chinensis]|uniref:uncharacterized protein LOC125024682 n=1 Tax=Penaeus chinensis TaxID=139456 RepID=UPI001FB6C4E1|nr:uncharacterized protein LOC125024682 [Penaeus chinensis]